MALLKPVHYDAPGSRHKPANPGDVIDPQYTHIPVSSGVGVLASGVLNATTVYTDTATNSTYYRDAAGLVVLLESGAAGGHSTTLATCPATGPTVAPTTEGHYYWTSTIGEKWCWIYGDAAPFICGPLYAETPLLNATFTSAGSVYTVRTTFTAPRNGNVLTTYTSSWLFNSAQVSLLDMRLRNLTAGTVVAEGSSSGSFSHAGTYEICVLTQVSPVSTGDILELSTRVFGSLALVHTSTLATCVFSYQG